MALDDRRAQGRRLRQSRVRKQIRGTDTRPRLCVFKSEKHVYAQVISDDSGQTLTAASTLSPELRDALPKTATVEAAKQVGALIASKCREGGIAQVVFDRNGFSYHGRVKALAEAAREGGLQF
jgi:large subunit ribosomal protein L18